MADRSRINVFIQTPLIFHYHLPLNLQYLGILYIKQFSELSKAFMIVLHLVLYYIYFYIIFIYIFFYTSPFLVPELGLQLVRGVEGSGLALLQLDLQLFDPRPQAHPQLLHLTHKPPNEGFSTTEIDTLE